MKNIINEAYTAKNIKVEILMSVDVISDNKNMIKT